MQKLPEKIKSFVLVRVLIDFGRFRKSYSYGLDRRLDDEARKQCLKYISSKHDNSLSGWVFFISVTSFCFLTSYVFVEIWSLFSFWIGVLLFLITMALFTFIAGKVFRYLLFRIWDRYVDKDGIPINCPECDYLLQHINRHDSMRCPECGAVIRRWKYIENAETS